MGRSVVVDLLFLIVDWDKLRLIGKLNALVGIIEGIVGKKEAFVGKNAYLVGKLRS
ncbi:hypothetical protein [Psychrobacillus sp. L3]|uniref:hypothetical protein n=1 Tax=Psychrobacillus sp. L3 TaxID=3236891 RepID=UPI0036F2F894